MPKISRIIRRMIGNKSFEQIPKLHCLKTTHPKKFIKYFIINELLKSYFKLNESIVKKVKNNLKQPYKIYVISMLTE